MSMISRLIDELNKSADEWNGSNMFELARMCRNAADTITELRGALQVASVDYRHLEAENAKLRELFGETLIRLAAANEAAGGGFLDARYCELLESYGIEVG